MPKRKFICEECGKEFIAYECQNRKFCSNVCRLTKLHRDTPEKRLTGKNEICLQCGKEFYVSKWRKQATRGKYCSRECYAKSKSISFKGKGNPQYKDGRVKLYGKIYLQIEWRKLRKEIYKRDNWTCKDCNKKGGELHTHHIISIGECQDPFNEENLITLCRKCHIKRHHGGDK